MSTLRLKFDDALEYQQDAVNAVCDVFQDLPPGNPVFSISYSTGLGLNISELGVGNPELPDPTLLLARLGEVQERNRIAKVAELDSAEFAIEMETGTGKTYVYLRTAFELCKRYGILKFVIVVPSIPIREGVLHSIATMSDHFRQLYPDVPFNHFVYSSKQTNRISDFARNNTMQIMVINIQAFQRDFKDNSSRAGNLIYREQDRLSGWAPIDYLQATRPFVIVDEPQRQQGEASQAAVQRLHPMCIVNYSATFDHPNMLYKLGPIEAHQQNLVKQIEVASVLEEENANVAYASLLKVDIAKQRAQVEMTVGQGANAKRKKVWLKHGDDLWDKSQNRLEYRQGYRVSGIDFDEVHGGLEFSGGHALSLHEPIGANTDAVMKAQVFETVREHLAKELALKKVGLKVLSLFFVDRVASYREYNEDGTTSLGKVGQWFETAYLELTATPRFSDLAVSEVGKVHDGYFSMDKRTKHAKDTSGKTIDDEDTYELIMRDKERLLSLDTPLRFIFSHSALREGWDNPNVFQICTLNESRSSVRKRQEIGRGLRLPVNQHGERIHDTNINRLTVVANESYRDFAATLQQEYEDETNIRFGIVPELEFSNITIHGADGSSKSIGQQGDATIRLHLQMNNILGASGEILPAFQPNRLGFRLPMPIQYESVADSVADHIRKFQFRDNQVKNARERRSLRLNKEILIDEEFEQFWNKISQRTRYQIRLDSDALVANAALYLQSSARQIETPKVISSTHRLRQSYAGVQPDLANRRQDYVSELPSAVPDVLAYLQNETELTRSTIKRIILDSKSVDKLVQNPQAFLNAAVIAIRKTLQSGIERGVTYEPLQNRYWALRLFEQDDERDLVRYMNKLYAVENRAKTVWDHVEYDSLVERSFAEQLDKRDDVKFFVKLPKWFVVDTPIGSYNPDWAMVVETDNQPKLYLVRETKGTSFKDELRATEERKIACAKKHFDAIDVDFGFGQELDKMLQEVQPSYKV